MPKQSPVPDAVSKPFWDACNERKLMVQNCTVCNRMQFPPEQVCANCGSAKDLVWKQVSGRGKVMCTTVVHDSRIKLRQADQPFNVAQITLEEEPAIMMFSNLPGTPVDKVPVGANVEVVWERVSSGQLIPEWRVLPKSQWA
jgi:hypothetical protein